MNAELNARDAFRGPCLIVSEASELDLAEALRAELNPLHYQAETIRYADALHVAMQGGASPRHLIAVLPRTPSPAKGRPALKPS